MIMQNPRLKDAHKYLSHYRSHSKDARRSMAVNVEDPKEAVRQQPGSQNTAGLDIEELRQHWLKPLWLYLGEAFSPEPRTAIVPHIWKWSEVRPRILEAGAHVHEPRT
jgi:gentisate 1,2-dioxygenase